MTTKLVAKCQSFWATRHAFFESRDRGATAVEYGLMVALIAVAIIGAVAALGDQITTMFESVTTEVGNAGN